MAKNLINKLIDKARKGALIATAVASLGVASCKFCASGPNPVNYPPEITSIPAPTEINEGSTYNYDVDATDINGDKLTYSLPLTPPWLSIDSNTGLISGTAPQVDSDTPFDIEVGVSDSVNPVVKQDYTLTVKNVVPPVDDFLDVEGYLQDNETDTAKQGTIKIYDSLKNFIGETQADSNGHFVFSSDSKKANELSEIIIQAQMTDSPGSYIRTIKADVSSSSEPDVTLTQPMRVVPYPSFCSNADFKTFMNQINFFSSGGNTYLLKWNLEQLQGIEILLQNPYNEVSFTPEQQQIIANRIKSPNDIEMFIEGRQLDSLIQIDSSYPPANPHYTDRGWIVVFPNNEVGGRTYFGYLNDSVLTGTINMVRIDLMPSVVNSTNPVMTHEFGHGFIAANPDTNGHSSVLLKPLTIMTETDLKLPPPGVADEKAGKIVYEDTYQPGEGIDDILGTNFY